MLYYPWDKYFERCELTSRASIGRIREGTALTNEMLERSRSFLGQSEKLLLDVPLMGASKRRFAGHKTYEPFPMPEEG